MATFAIGDVQGCYYSLQDLIKKIPFDSTKDDFGLSVTLLIEVNSH